MITETVLEMHYQKPLMDLFRSTFGLGTGGISFYKYSQQRETFIGFDQAYAKTDLSQEDFFHMLRHATMSTSYTLPDKFLAYFLQFKVVKEMRKRMRHTPANIHNTPHYRVALYTTRSVNTDTSQHELLYNLNQNQGAMVYYACPMLFDRAALYDVDVDLDELRLADLATCPSSYPDNEKHFIYYDDHQGEPVWCTEPVKGKAIASRDLASTVTARVAQLDPAHSARELLRLLTDVEGAGVSEESEYVTGATSPSILPLVGESLTIIRIESSPTAGEGT